MIGWLISNKSHFTDKKEIFLYLVFGVLTTAVNVAVFALLRAAGVLLGAAVLVAWLASVLFAFVTNRRFVFCAGKSGTNGAGRIFREAILFFASRILTGALDFLLMAAFAGRSALGTDTRTGETVLKILANVIVVILNFILSKMIVFKKSAEGNSNPANNKRTNHSDTNHVDMKKNGVK